MKCSICEQEIPAGQCAHWDGKDMQHTTCWFVHKEGMEENSIGLTDKEKDVIAALSDAWNKFLLLPARGPSDTEVFNHAIDSAHGVIAFRVAKRLNPEIWR